jgi:hypothetical protein
MKHDASVVANEAHGSCCSSLRDAKRLKHTAAVVARLTILPLDRLHFDQLHLTTCKTKEFKNEMSE